MSHGKQFTLYSSTLGPNGWKILFLFEELGLTYEIIYLDFTKGEQKEPPYVDLNPNGRIPAIVDHQNKDFVVWESDAILLYLVDKYDADGKFKFTDSNDYHRQVQWLLFQASGQGPYYGQAAHFILFHPVQVPTAVKRYQDEIKRVTGVLEIALSKSEWLVGGKFSIADLSFFPYQTMAMRNLFLTGTWDHEKEAPHVYAWYQRMAERPSFKKVRAKYDEVTKASGYAEMWQDGHRKFSASLAATQEN